LVGTNEERYYEAELYRLKGALLLQHSELTPCSRNTKL
jgi:hypothetical protein